MRNKICLATLVLALALLPSCQRPETPDQPWEPNAGFEYFIEGMAIPSLIYLPEINATSIKVKVSRNDGTPVVGAEILFKHWSNWGVFDSGTTSVQRLTNSSGEAWATFIITKIATGDTQVDAYLVSNFRVVYVYDEIPISVIAN